MPETTAHDPSTSPGPRVASCTPIHQKMDNLAIYFVQTLILEVPAEQHPKAWAHFYARVSDFYKEASRLQLEHGDTDG